MRILIVHNSADIYGASRSIVRLCGRLDRGHFEPLVLLPECGPLQDMLTTAGVRTLIFTDLRVITRPVLKSWRLIPWLIGFVPSALRMAALLRRERIDLVHTNTGVICSSSLAAKLAGRPHIWHIRDWFQEFGPLWGPYSRYILALSTRVLCVSRPIAGQFPPSDKIEVLNNGFDLAEFPPLMPEERSEARTKWNITPDAFVVGAVGRIKFVRKGQEFLLQAAALLKDQGIPITCLLVGGASPGSEDHIDRMKALADELQVEAIFTGELPDPRLAYAAMDIFVLPSAQPEPFGGVVMEAMALGLPVVGTAIGGTSEQVAEGETGLLVPPADPKALAGALARLANSEKERHAMGDAARERIRTIFSLDAMVERIQDIYLKCHVVGRKRA
jgi:glycosyltransferase involved in cell wall biosynthesis